MLPRFADAPGGILMARTSAQTILFGTALAPRPRRGVAIGHAFIARMEGACCCRTMEVGP